MLDKRETEPGDTAKAVAIFSVLVREIPDVLAVRISGGPTLQEKRFAVVVATLFSEAADRVFELEASLFRKYPQAHLDVHLEIEQGARLP